VPVTELRPEHCEALLQFFRALPEGDLTYIEEEVTDADVVRAWARGEGGGSRWVAVADADDGPVVTGYVVVRPLPGWSDHVGRLRLVVAPPARGSGLGRDLARHALVQAVAAGLTKIVVEVAAEQGAALSLFTGLGFRGEAVLVDHVRDREGRLRDLMVLAHHVGDTWAGMDAVGLGEELGAGPA
jgi:ribosomal protein S18 acetylase RimI-like enzyme